MAYNADGILSKRTSLQLLVQPIGLLIEYEVFKCMNMVVDIFKIIFNIQN